MVRGQGGKKGLIVTIIVLALTLIAVGTIVFLQSKNSQTMADTSSTSTTVKDEEKTETTETTTTESDTSVETTESAVDPATLSSIDIEPLAITVFYTKGVGSFEFVVKRAADSTQYVEFSTSDLAGTKCTDDMGVFASIVVSPSSQAAISKTVVVDGTTYGLSLSGTGCASDTGLLEKYQTGFTNGFSSLKVMK